MHDGDVMSAENARAYAPCRQAEPDKQAVFVSRRKPNSLGKERAAEKQAAADRRQFGERPGPLRESLQFGEGGDALAREVAKSP